MVIASRPLTDIYNFVSSFLKESLLDLKDVDRSTMLFIFWNNLMFWSTIQLSRAIFWRKTFGSLQSCGTESIEKTGI